MDSQSFSVAKYRAYAAKMPSFYAFMLLPVVMQGMLFHDQVPWWACTAPTLTMICYGTAMILWWRRAARQPVDERQAGRRMRAAGIAIILGALTLTAIDLYLFDVADESYRDYLVLQAVITTLVGACFNLLLKRVATLVAVIGTSLAVFELWLMHRPFSGMIALFLIATVLGTGRLFSQYNLDLEAVVQARLDTQRLAEANTRLASLDMITGLPNRREFFRVLHDALEDHVRADMEVCVGLVDLDGFKAVNDTHGHRIGDRVLAVVASRLQSALKAATPLFRLGGDEFAFVLIGDHGQRRAAIDAQALIGAVSRTIRIDQLTTSVGCSVGLAWCADDEMRADRLYECADFALFEAKRQGRGRAVVFSPEHLEQMQAQGRIENALRVADLDAEFYPVFQPLTDSETGTVVAFESLARWTSPTVGAVSPAVFVPIAEQSGLISQLTAVLLGKTLAVMQSWPQSIAVSFNLSSHDLINQGGVGRILEIIRDSGLDPRRIGLELTETALLNNFDTARRNMEILRAQGVRVALDDFGAGFSSLSHVNLLPLDKLKIDRSFIVNVESSRNSQKIIRLLTQLCDELQIECIVEGVETPKQVAVLNGLGCRIMQGYVYARPMRSTQVLDYVADAAAAPPLLNTVPGSARAADRPGNAARDMVGAI